MMKKLLGIVVLSLLLTGCFNKKETALENCADDKYANFSEDSMTSVFYDINNTKIINLTKSLESAKIKQNDADNKHTKHVKKNYSFDGAKLKDETAWCSAFVNWVAKTAGHEYTGKLTARSWLSVGESTNSPSPGDVVVLWRESPNSWKGHVGFFIKETNRFVYLLGGNQRNSVCIKAYSKNRILDFKRLKKDG